MKVWDSRSRQSRHIIVVAHEVTVVVVHEAEAGAVRAIVAVVDHIHALVPEARRIAVVRLTDAVDADSTISITIGVSLIIAATIDSTIIAVAFTTIFATIVVGIITTTIEITTGAKTIVFDDSLVQEAIRDR